MESLFKTMLEKMNQKESMVLCSIIASSGSTPRGKGAKMLVFSDGSTFGTIGGGAVEYESSLLAKKALDDHKSFQHSYDLSPNETADIGMVCGGAVTVYFQYVAFDNSLMKEMAAYICNLFSENRDTWLITHINDNHTQLALYERNKGLVYGDLDKRKIKPLLKNRGVLVEGEETIYVEPLTSAGLVYVFGGGHVSQELVPLLSNVGFKVCVFEDREAFVRKDLFPSAHQLILGDFQAIEEKIKITDADYFIIMTRGHQSDYDVLKQVMLKDFKYVGVIGSASKKAHTFKRLEEVGVEKEKLNLIHTPIGLVIKGETPAEIAVSITGELILHRSKG